MVGLTQHAGLAENVIDHRLNSRTVYMNPVFRFLYWNMNYHVEHHMFPMVPYHALPKLHAIMLPDTPKPYASTWEAYKEIIPALMRQRREPEWFVRRAIAADGQAIPPGPARRGRGRPLNLAPKHAAGRRRSAVRQPTQFIDTSREDLSWATGSGPAKWTISTRKTCMRFDHDGRTFAVYRSPDDEFFATDGLCTHERVHLADGLVMDDIIECPKHNGRFNYRTGQAKGAPACVNLKTYPVKVDGGQVYIQLG